MLMRVRPNYISKLSTEYIFYGHKCQKFYNPEKQKIKLLRKAVIYSVLFRHEVPHRSRCSSMSLLSRNSFDIHQRLNCLPMNTIYPNGPVVLQRQCCPSMVTMSFNEPTLLRCLLFSHWSRCHYGTRCS